MTPAPDAIEVRSPAERDAALATALPALLRAAMDLPEVRALVEAGQTMFGHLSRLTKHDDAITGVLNAWAESLAALEAKP